MPHIDVTGLSDLGVFEGYAPETRAPGMERVAFARNGEGQDFYDLVYAHGEPATGRTFVYVDDGARVVISVVHDDQDVVPPQRTLLGHPVIDHCPVRILSFDLNTAVTRGLTWDGATAFTSADPAA